MYFPTFILISVLAARSVNGHGLVTAVTGANGVTGQGFGVDPSTPRDGTKRDPFQQDTSIIRNNEVQSGKAEACGRTLQSGNIDMAAALQQASSAGLPSAAADGTVTMTVHQVNADGAGPYKCDVSTDGTGQNFQEMTVSQNVPGVLSLSTAKAQDFTLTAQMPAGATCTGGPQQNACVVRCRNSAIAGPFGSCAAVTNAGDAGAAAAGNGTAAAGGAAGAAGAAGGAAGATGATGASSAAGSTASSGILGATGAGGATGATGAKAAKAGGAGGLLGKLTGALGAGAAGGDAAGGAAGGAGGLLGKLAGAAGANKRQETEPTDEERDAALAQDLDRRDARVVKSRVVGASNMGRWI